VTIEKRRMGKRIKEKWRKGEAEEARLATQKQTWPGCRLG
jgi:hypothetical protein